MTTPFKEQLLNAHHTIGERLRAAREGKHLEVVMIAKELRISPRFLEALEGGRYNEIPSVVYTKNYLRLYAQYLGIPWEKIATQYEQEIRTVRTPHHTPSRPLGGTHTPHRQRGAHQQHPLLIPRLVKLGIAGIAVLILVLYFVWQLVQFFSPPTLSITAPAQDELVHSPRFVLEGMTEPEMIVEVNGQVIAVQPDGRFQEELFLHEGVNTIRVTAHSEHSNNREVVRNILYRGSE